MAALASIDDYEAITGQAPTGADAVRVGRLLELASDAVLAGAHGQQIIAGTSTEVLRPWEGVIRFPQRPVTAVTSVTVAGTVLAPDDYRWTRGGDRRPAYLIRRSAGVDIDWDWPEVTVEWSHGWAQTPGQIVAVVCAMAESVMTGGGGPAVVQESTGPFQVTLAAGQAQSPDMSLLPSTRVVLDRLCGVDGPASVPVTAAWAAVL